ncbi:hypothetical protein HY732_01335 [Candidatus Uhrbacteria bacterium]|nr:hypothetical protein [Candidatus Uhrbacteria bacterium]
MPTCRECNSAFSVHPNDQKILDYFSAPEPTLCATHSLQQRLSWRNERHLYTRTCELCKKEILAVYSLRSYAKVLCNTCWYGDGWDPLGYGRDYDPSQSFIDQWYALMKDVPHVATVLYQQPVNCEYANWIVGGKDNYLTFSAVQSEGSLYSRLIDYSRDCSDCLSVLRSELLYDCVSTTDSHACAFVTRAEKCSDCYLGRDLHDCQNCFGCVNLKHRQYYWYNEKCSKEEYERRLNAAFQTRTSFEEHMKKFDAFSSAQPVECATIRRSEDSVGNEIYNSRLVRKSFTIVESENISESMRIAYDAHDIYRCSFGGSGATTGYECSSTPGTNTVLCSFCAGNCAFSSYCYFCINSQDLFGCVNLRKKQFCILNKQYDEGAYKKLRDQIIADMKKRGEWAEFFPMRYSPLAYNESLAHEYLPLSGDNAVKIGLRWEDEEKGVRGKETIMPETILSDTSTIDEHITKEILRCVACTANYRILRKELGHLKKMRLPIPLECQDCRFKSRMKRFFVPILYHRTCMCTEGHAHHGSASCTNEFETTYRPDGKDIVYCHPCYQELLS